MKVGIIDYNAGNVHSVISAVQRLGHEIILTDDIQTLQQCDAILFPGQGEASNAMRHLRERGLDSFIRTTQLPLLGICIGMQLLCSSSEEGDTECLGIFDVPVRRFIPEHNHQKVPHMGWNSIEKVSDSQFNHSQEGQFVYFVHSYYVPICQYTSAVTHYIHPFSAALQRDNYYAAQFHPEKSGQVGEETLRTFFEHVSASIDVK